MKKILLIVLAVLILVCPCIGFADDVQNSVSENQAVQENIITEPEGDLPNEIQSMPVLTLESGNDTVVEEDTWNGIHYIFYESGLLSLSGEMIDENRKDYPWKTSTISAANVTKVVFENGFKKIPVSAFEKFENLSEIEFSDSIQEICASAFKGCSKLTSVDIPENCSVIGEIAFKSCSSLGKVSFPVSASDSILDNIVFSFCSNLNEIDVTGSGNLPGVNDTNCYPWSTIITKKTDVEVTLSEKIANIGDNVFNNCSNIKDMSLGVNTTYSDTAFDGCNSVENFTLMDDGSGIMRNFTDDYQNTPWYISGKNHKISVTIEDSIKNIGDYAFSGNEGITSFITGSKVESIGKNSFSGCKNLLTFTAGENITSLGDSAFSGCSVLSSFIIGEKVATLGDSLFSGCSKLTSAIFLCDEPSISDNIFSGDKLTAYYDHNKTWSKSALQNYGGSTTWKMCCGKDSLDVETADPKVDPTFTEDGKTAGSHCSKCGKAIVAQQSITRLGDLDLSYIGVGKEVFVDGKSYFTDKDGHICLPDGNAKTMTIYSYNKADVDPHKVYPTDMKVYRLKFSNNKYSSARLEALDNCLQYAGASIKVTGDKGIRVITGVPTDMRNSLIADNVAGYSLEEYGTLLAFSSKITDSNPLVIGGNNVISNYAYLKNVVDPIFKVEKGLTKYTNPIVGFSQAQCSPDLSIRPYIKLLDHSTGEVITIYGGIVQRSIKYIAEQNKDAFPPGSDAYNYIWSIING